MKKLVLKLGLTTMAILPVVAVASCSSTTPEVPTIETEVKNFQQTFTAKPAAQSTTTQAAIATLNGNGDAQTKWTYLSTLVQLPQTNNNFTYEVESAALVANSKTSITVTIKITEKTNTSNTKTAQLTISQLTQSDLALEAEVKRFNISAAANEASKALKATAVIEEINKLQDGAKLVKLQEYTTVPKPTEGFSIKVVSAKIGSEDTSVEVKISVTEDATTQSMDATFTVTGFATLTAQEKFDSQVALLVNQQVLDSKKGQTPLQAKTAMTNETLKDYYKPISLSFGATYEFASAEPNATTKTTLDVTLTVKSNVEGVNDTTKKVEITGFTSPQTLLEEKAALIGDKPVLSPKANETAAMAAAGITDDTTLESYYAKVDLGTGFSYALKTGSPEAVGDTVKVIVTVTSADTNTTPIDKPFFITGFKTAVEVEAAKLTTAAAKNADGTTRQIIAGINGAASQQDKLTALTSIVDLPTLTGGFTIEVGLASQNPDVTTSVNVILTVLQTNTENKANATFVITGLTAETAQQEVDRLATANLVDQNVLPGKSNETAATASDRITSIETFTPYYTLKTLPKGLSYIYTSNLVENNNLKVTMSVSSEEAGITAASRTFTISGFATPQQELDESANLIKSADVLPRKATETAAIAAKKINPENFHEYYEPITMPKGITYKPLSAIASGNSVKLTIEVSSIDTSLTRKQKSIRLNGFKAPTALETEAVKLWTSLAATDGTIETGAVITAINTTAETQEAKLTALKGYVTGFPVIADTYTLEIGTVAVDPTTPTSVNVPIKVSKKAVAPVAGEEVEQPIDVIFTITGLTQQPAE